MKNVSSILIVAAAALLVPYAASAQQAPDPAQRGNTQSYAAAQNPPAGQQAARDAERVAKRFRLGLEGGVGLDPELLIVGGHAAFGPIFVPNLEFRPGVELGLGEVTTLFGINLDVLYTLPGATDQRWTPYVGGGPNFSLSHRGFESEDDDDLDDGGNRFDFGDTDFNGGFNFIAGARNQSGLFFELKATAYGVSNIRLLAGFNF